jgi:site-specific DNA recombinase
MLYLRGQLLRSCPILVIINGNHEPIIPETLYHKVQEIINHRKPANIIKKSDRDEFPLRGLLICCKCGRLLTGSSGLSKTGRRYFYYHCTKGCKEIYPIDKVHRAFVTVLESIVSRGEWIRLYQEALRVILVENKGDSKEQLLKLQTEIDKNKNRVTKAMQMMLDGQLDSSDYKAIKEQYETANASILKERAILSSQKDYTTDIAGTFGLLSNITGIFQSANTETKKRIVSLNFPGKLIFENDKVQTPRMNNVLSLIMMNDSELQDIKKGQTLKNSHLSPIVRLRDKISNTLLQELEMLSALYQVVKDDVQNSKAENWCLNYISLVLTTHWLLQRSSHFFCTWLSLRHPKNGHPPPAFGQGNGKRPARKSENAVLILWIANCKAGLAVMPN